MDNHAPIKKKIRELFEYRKISELLELSQVRNSDKLLEGLTALQIAIYELDQCLEQIWNLEPASLEKYWRNIYATLQPFKLSKEKVQKLTQGIRIYQKHELGLRQGIMPFTRSFHATYNAKTCDVRLMRDLIYLEDPGLSRIIPKIYWKYFDLVTEVNDDIEDIFEDIGTFNGNRFLISIADLGKTRTCKDYRTFLKQLQNESQAFFRKRKNQASEDMAGLTDEQIKSTLRLLRTREKEIKKEISVFSK